MRRAIRRLLRIGPVVVTAAVALILFGVFGVRYEGFASLRVVCAFFADNAFLGVVAIGMTFVILSGGIDLSVGAVLGFATILIAALVEIGGWHPAPAVGLALLLGALHGAAMGGLIERFALPPFIVTLAGMFLARGAGFVVSQEAIAMDHPFYRAVADLPMTAATALGAGDGLALRIATHLPTASWLLAAALAAAVVVAHRTPFGRAVYAIGGHEPSARLMGLPVGRTKVAVYAISGFCAALGGAIYTLYTFSGNPSAGVMLELDAIAAVVIGGTLLSGGVGTVAGTLLGVLIFAMIQTVIVFDGSLSSWWTRIAIGGLLLGFILLQRFLQGTMKRMERRDDTSL